MSIHFSSVVRNQVLWITATGQDDNLADVRQYNLAVYALMKQHQCSRVCADERNLIYRISVMDTFKVAEEASTHAADIERVAITCQQKFWETGTFFENVAVNRGLTVRFFIDHEEASRWILEG